MKIIKGIKVGGLQQKIFNLMLLFILLLVGAYVAVSVWQQRSLTNIVQESGARQQESITAVSEETMEAVLSTSMTRSTALQAYIADDLFGDVRTDVLTLQAFATELFAHADASPLTRSPRRKLLTMARLQSCSSTSRVWTRTALRCWGWWAT